MVNTNLRIIDDNIRTLGIEFKSDEQGSKDACDCQQNIMSILKMNFQEINSTFKQMKEMRRKRQKEKVCIEKEYNLYLLGDLTETKHCTPILHHME